MSSSIDCFSNLRTPSELPRLVAVAIATIFLQLGPLLAQATPDEAPPPAEEAGALASQILQDFQDVAQAPGFSIAILHDGKLQYVEQFGFADLEQLVPVTALTRFRIGSVSKALTAVLLMELVEEGSVDLDAPVRSYLPSFPDKGHPISIRQLAGHLGGIRHYKEGESTNHVPLRGTAASLKRFADDPLLHPPGSAYKYSSYGYVLLGAALEPACGTGFERCLEDRVLVPLGLESITEDYPDRIVLHRTRFYEHTGGSTKNAPFSDRIYKLAAGGYLGTAADLARFGGAVLGDSLLSADSRRLLFTSQRTEEGEETGYGMGFRPGEDWSQRPVAHHGGTAEGARSFLLVYPEQDLALGFTSNLRQTSFFKQEAFTIASLFLDGVGSKLPSDDLDRLAGAYEFTSGEGEGAITGTLQLLASAVPDRGWLFIAGDRPIAIRLSAVRQRDGKTWIVGSARQGMMNLWVTFSSDGFVGNWDWYGKTREITGERLD